MEKVYGKSVWKKCMEKEDYYNYMKKALEVAKRAKGKCSPNPAVGAVLVKGGQIVSEGATKKVGSDHAEIVAIKEAKAKGFKDLQGTTLFVTLEPCSFFGHTPPCTDAIIKERISKVIIGSKDKDPRSNNGNGIRRLIKAGIEVIEIEFIEYTKLKTLSQAIYKLNEDFNKYILHNLPFCTAKYAMSLDGKIADSNANSKWISNEKSRHIVQHLRNKTDAIIIGANTLLNDNPSLTVRLDNKQKNPLRIIVSKSLDIPINSKVLHDEYKTLLVSKVGTSKNKNVDALQNIISTDNNKRLIFDPTTDKDINLLWLFKTLCTEENISSILLEGGGKLLSSSLEYKLIDKVICFVAPKIITGQYTPFSISVKSNIDEAIKLKDVSYKQLGDNMMFSGYVDYV